MPALLRRLAPLVAVVLLAVPLGACSVPGQTNTPVRAGVNGSLAAIKDKVDAISMDECATKDPATVFPNCPRFITEVGNVAVAVKGGAPGHPGAEQLASAATSAGDAVSGFISAGCVFSPSQPAPTAGTCGPALARIQNSLRAMKAALKVSAAT